MAQSADFIQENIPEQLPLKQRMLAEVSRHAGADVIIASSTSGLTPTDLQRDMVAPERFCVAHPFNPVYLLPLVELVGGAKTAPATIEAAASFFTYIGMHALQRAARSAGAFDRPAAGGDVARDSAHGERRRRDHRRARRIDHLRPGLALGRDGHELIYHLAGGETRHAPHARAVRPGAEMAVDQARGAGTDRDADRPHGRRARRQQAAGRSIRELERLRDDYLVAIQQVLRQFDIGAGSTLRSARGAALPDAAPASDARPEGRARQVSRSPRFDTSVRPEWVDYNGHMSDFRYVHVFGEAMDVLYRERGRRRGVPRQRDGCSTRSRAM